MSSVAILGAGPIGSAIAHRLAERARVSEVRLIDDAGSVAAGKALDIRQTGPIDGYDTLISGSSDVLAAAGADVIVFADSVGEGEWEGDKGLALVQRLVRAGAGGAFVFAGPKQTWLMESAAREARLPIDRIVGTAAAATPHIVSALLHVETGLTGASVSVTGRPPSFVVNWSAATLGGRLVTDFVPAHRLLAMSQSLSKLWPAGPQSIAAPTAAIVEGLISGTRAALPGAAITDGEFGSRGVAALLLLECGGKRITRQIVPTQSPQERTETSTVIQKK